MSVSTNSQNGHSAPSPFDGAVDHAAIARGHEVDTYDKLSVFSVPLMVVGFFALAFTTVTIVFYFTKKTEVDPNANPFAVNENAAPLNKRLERIHRDKNLEKDQPRLEPLRLREGDARAITEPETPTGNSPELHPEDIQVSKKNTPELFESGPVPQDKSAEDKSGNDKSANRIPIEQAMTLILEKLPARKLEKGEMPSSIKVPTGANAGRGAADSVAVPPKSSSPLRTMSLPEDMAAPSSNSLTRNAS